MFEQNSLADLDELVLLCRDERARSYIAEAVKCYRSGAYKAAIVSAWIAVCYDVIDKFRELSLSGDKEAERIIEAMNRARENNDLANALKFERELLEIARDKFELISHLEFLDLDRLQQDRNRCAHPSLVSDEEAFNPPAELARLHIRAAVTHVLQHPPVQGKYALDRLLREVNSEYFPTNKEKAISSLSSGPLRRPRESLVRNFIVVLVKSILSDETELKAKRRYKAALQAVSVLHPASFEDTSKEKFCALVRALPDEQLMDVVLFFFSFQQCWDVLDADVVTRLENFVRELPAEEIGYIEILVNMPAISEQALHRINQATRIELSNAFFVDPPESMCNRFVHLYIDSPNFDLANSFARTISIYVSEFTEAQQRRIVEGIAQNEQVRGSFEVGSVVAAMRKSETISNDDFDELLGEFGLEEYQLVDED